MNDKLLLIRMQLANVESENVESPHVESVNVQISKSQSLNIESVNIESANAEICTYVNINSPNVDTTNIQRNNGREQILNVEDSLTLCVTVMLCRLTPFPPPATLRLHPSPPLPPTLPFTTVLPLHITKLQIYLTWRWGTKRYIRMELGTDLRVARPHWSDFYE
jgi:hypothetical protein